MSTGFKIFLGCIFFLWLSALMLGFFQLGSQSGAREPLRYSPDIPLEKVIGWCVLASVEQLADMGADKETIMQNLPTMREDCEDRWLAFSKRWERGDVE